MKKKKKSTNYSFSNLIKHMECNNRNTNHQKEKNLSHLTEISLNMRNVEAVTPMIGKRKNKG
jgi:hypothetical protein